MEANDIKDLRFIVKNDLQPIIRVSIAGVLAIVSFIVALITLESAIITWSFICVTMFFVERHISWCFGRKRHEYNRMHHGR